MLIILVSLGPSDQVAISLGRQMAISSCLSELTLLAVLGTVAGSVPDGETEGLTIGAGLAGLGVPMLSVVALRSLSKAAYIPSICLGLPFALASKLASMIMLTSWVWAVPNQSGLLDLIAATCSLEQVLMFFRSHSSAKRARCVSSLVRSPIPLKWATRQPAGLSS